MNEGAPSEEKLLMFRSGENAKFLQMTLANLEGAKDALEKHLQIINNLNSSAEDRAIALEFVEQTLATSFQEIGSRLGEWAQRKTQEK